MVQDAYDEAIPLMGGSGIDRESAVNRMSYIQHNGGTSSSNGSSSVVRTDINIDHAPDIDDCMSYGSTVTTPMATPRMNGMPRYGFSAPAQVSQFLHNSGNGTIKMASHDYQHDHRRTPSNTCSLPRPNHHRNTSNAPSEYSSILIKTQGESFLDDAINFAPGSIPHSMVLAAAIGVVCGVAAYIYYTILFWALDFLWHDLPEKYIFNHTSIFPEWSHVLWIPFMGFAMAMGVGLTVRFMGEPGDLPYTIQCVHEKAYVAMSHVMPMVVASLFSMLAGGSLGPEAPLVAICAALGGFCSRTLFGCTNRNLVRKHTLMGMAGALAAFFGCPLGGSLFAMEVNSRFGIEYFEHTLEAILCGQVCLGVFRALAGLPIASIWDLTDGVKLTSGTPIDLVYGAFLGCVGAFTAWVFAKMHFKVMGLFRRNKLLTNEYAIYRALAGSVVVVGLGMLIPHTMFWGEFEIQTVGTLAPASTLFHIWPTAGLIGFEMNSTWTCLLVGVTKLIAISFSVAGGYRGGYIFPMFCSAAALGRAIFFVMPFIPVQLCVLCTAAALNVALTRTALATTLILSYLAGEQNAVSSILAASLVSLFLTAYMPFIQTQIVRADLDFAVYQSDDYPEVEDEKHHHVVEGGIHESVRSIRTSVREIVAGAEIDDHAPQFDVETDPSPPPPPPLAGSGEQELESPSSHSRHLV